MPKLSAHELVCDAGSGLNYKRSRFLRVMAKNDPRALSDIFKDTLCKLDLESTYKIFIFYSKRREFYSVKDLLSIPSYLVTGNRTCLNQKQKNAAFKVNDYGLLDLQLSLPKVNFSS